MSDPATAPRDPVATFEAVLKRLVTVPKKELDRKVKAFKRRKKNRPK